MKHTLSLRSTTLATLVLAMATLAACHHETLEDKAEKMARDYTERYCPTPMKNMQRTDSIVFDRNTHTFCYYYLVSGAADNKEVLDSMRPQLREALIKDLVGNVGNKVYKEAGYSYRYVFFSETTKQLLYEEELTEKDYK